MTSLLTPSTALSLIASIGATVWIISAYFLANSPAIAARRSRAEPGKLDPESGFFPGLTTIVGAIEVAIEPVGAATKLAAALARGGLGPGPIEIIEKADYRVAFAVPGPPRNPRGEVRVSPAGGHTTRFEYVIEYGALRGFLRGGWIVQACGLIVLAVMYWALRTYVVPSPNPAVRWQCVQMVQCVHLLWPPFLLGFLYRAGYRNIRRFMDTTIRNLPHTTG